MFNRSASLVFAASLALSGVTCPVMAQLVIPGLTQPDPSILVCASVDAQTTRCPLPSGSTATFLRQISQAACVSGSSYTIERDSISVSKGCRAEFKLSSEALSGSALTEDMRKKLTAELIAKVKADNAATNVQFEILSDRERYISSSETGFSGTGRLTVSGRRYDTEFDSVYRHSSRSITKLTYQTSAASTASTKSSTSTTKATDTGVSMDAQSRTALVQAIVAELKKDSRVRTAQVAINDRYSERFESQRDVWFSGKFGVSINDGDWTTRTYEARMYLPRDQVNELKLGYPRY